MIAVEREGGLWRVAVYSTALTNIAADGGEDLCRKKKPQTLLSKAADGEGQGHNLSRSTAIRTQELHIRSGAASLLSYRSK